MSNDDVQPKRRGPVFKHTEEYRQRVINFLKEQGGPQPRGAIFKACNIPKTSFQFILKDARFGVMKNGRIWLTTDNGFVQFNKPMAKFGSMNANKFSISFKPREVAPQPHEYIKVITDLLYQKQPLFLEEIARYTKIPKSTIFKVVSDNPNRFERVERVYWLAGEARHDTVQVACPLMETTSFLPL